MIQSLYVSGSSWLHRLPAGLKLGVLLVAGIGLFLVDRHDALAAAATASFVLLWQSGVSARRLWQQTRGMALIVLIVFGAAWFFNGWWPALTVLLRLLALISLALTVTFSTRSDALFDACEKALRPLERTGLVNASRVSLALALTLRFMPEIHRRYQAIREAQAARGVSASPVALVVPLVVAVLKSADAIAEAIDARGYPPD